MYSSHWLYESGIDEFINAGESSLFGVLCDNYHGVALTTTREAWKAEISIMKQVLLSLEKIHVCDRISRHLCLYST